jgi:hypothetical protein
MSNSLIMQSIHVDIRFLFPHQFSSFVRMVSPETNDDYAVSRPPRHRASSPPLPTIITRRLPCPSSVSIHLLATSSTDGNQNNSSLFHESPAVAAGSFIESLLSRPTNSSPPCTSFGRLCP